MEIKRSKYLNDLVLRMGNGMVKVVTGVRRCGKSYLLLNLFEDHLRANGVDDSHIVEVVLDDESNAALRDPVRLAEHLSSRIGDDARTHYLILDEVQYAISNDELRDRDNPPRLYGVLNGLLRKRNVDVYVTGSNSKLLSTDVMTEFRGRGDEVRVHPLSFAEFMQAYDGDPRRGWDEYAVFGGMPLTLSMRDAEQKMKYLGNLFAETYFKDIIERNRIERTQELEDVVNVLASNIGSLTSVAKLQATFESVLHSKISDHTIASYVNHLKDAFVIDEAARYSVKGRRYIGSPKKFYFEDVGLRNARLGFRQLDEPRIMENVVYNELKARGYSVDVGVVEQRRTVEGKQRREQLEVDFVANLGHRRYYLQVAQGLDDPGKEAQEKRSLKGIPDGFKKIIVVRDALMPHYDDDGFLIIGLTDFLLDPRSLDI
ncbi:MULTISPECIES: ATP-binding protein [unclassified Adlercreutzia]|uniref:ATP-binding protein n=1 Tax=unclassified Adlercreutzia TaxID=2636013 RepID=UPI0013EB186F|nr:MULTISPECIES: ATP-binding protein [unclassified Adlercreutzia]